MRLIALATSACFALFAWPTSVRADDDDLLAFAEAAYRDVEFERTVELVDEALESGSLSAKRLARAYTLLAVAAAAVHEVERSREAWIRLLALTPETRAARDLSPQMRAPYLEAKGFWSAQAEPMSVKGLYLRRRTSVRVDVVDPVGMGAMVAVRWRSGDDRAFREARFLAQERIYVPAEGMGPDDRIEYVIRLLDEYGNRIVELGDDDAPRSDEPAGGPAGATSAGEEDQEFVGSGLFWLGVGAVTVGAAAGAVILLTPPKIEGRTRVSVGIR
jgi:hypothetical protein